MKIITAVIDGKIKNEFASLCADLQLQVKFMDADLPDEYIHAMITVENTDQIYSIWKLGIRYGARLLKE